MMLKLVVLFALFALTAGQGGQCQMTCKVDFECSHDGTGRCANCMNHVSPLPGKCGSGCNRTCTEDSDCMDANCQKCTNGQCEHHISTNATCGQECWVDAACSGPDGSCKHCLGLPPKNATKRHPGKCGSGCKQPCTKNTDCLDANCNTCNQGICWHPSALPCQAKCETSAECDKETCPYCVARSPFPGKCLAGCLGACTTDGDCQVGCGTCKDKKCQAP
eukprot:NODE_1764_length_894_cov_1689.872189_g1234_i0.p1 GENE.NODE_1764_length_894_cov_1689.872189_g1234_i0~~NODE_1764_length_894_cov_1689.872189_g1234_i0.p1  ORF type:complete len:238 (-),score=99.39 NODE_1764_length_894_cov_1689.872189_g1234_i0:181-840(-)